MTGYIPKVVILSADAQLTEAIHAEMMRRQLAVQITQLDDPDTMTHPASLQDWLALDILSIGQNALNQAEQFHKSIPLTGITITKLDGTAKGGIIFAIADRMQVPIRFIGVGEGIEDLRHFDAEDFVRALFEE